jgi:hypothetical protein
MVTSGLLRIYSALLRIGVSQKAGYGYCYVEVMRILTKKLHFFRRSLSGGGGGGLGAGGNYWGHIFFSPLGFYFFWSIE